MTDELERELRTALAEHIQEVPTGPVVERLAQVDYQPRTRPRVAWLPAWMPVWPAVSGGAAVLVAAAVVVAIVSLSSGTTAALAGWTAVPARVTKASSAAARKACGNIASKHVLAAESRGPFVAIVFVRSGATWQCITRGSRVIIRNQMTQFPQLSATVPAGKITQPSLAYGFEQQIFHTRTGPAALVSLIGAAGKRVTGIRFVLADRKRVSATVQDGWYEAWWPTTLVAGSAVKVEVTTQSGTRSSTIPARPLSAVGPLSAIGPLTHGDSVFAPVLKPTSPTARTIKRVHVAKHTKGCLTHQWLSRGNNLVIRQGPGRNFPPATNAAFPNGEQFSKGEHFHGLCTGSGWLFVSDNGKRPVGYVNQATATSHNAPTTTSPTPTTPTTLSRTTTTG